jgi:uncharacterized protein YbcI
MPPAEPDTRHGPQAMAITNALVHLMHDATGRGPNKARADLNRDSVILIMEDTLTAAERTLASHGREEEVLNSRHGIQEIIGPDAIRIVESVTGRTVTGFMSQNHIEPDLAVEIFVLHPLPPDNGGRPSPDPV